MRRTTLAFVAAVTVAGCAAEHGTTHPGGATAAADGSATVAETTPPGGSSPVPVLIGVAIGAGLLLLILANDNPGASAAFLPPA